MNSIQELREQRNTIATEMRALVDKNPAEKWTKELSKRFDALENMAAKIDGEIERQQQVFDDTAAAMHEGRTGRFGITGSGEAVRIFSNKEHMSKLGPDESWNLSDYVRAGMGLQVQNAAVERGDAIAPQRLAMDIIDAVRSKSRIVQAGAMTMPIDGPTTLCRIASDPVVYQHTEAATDISESVPGLEPVKLDPKALVALIPLTMEAVADSPNLEAVLRHSVSAAFATKLDALSLATILADEDIPTSATGQATDTWAGVLAAVGSMLGADQMIPGAMICNSADYIARASQVTDGGWLGAPPALGSMLDLETTKVTAGTAILGRFDLGCLIAVRSDIRFELIRWQKPTSATHQLVVHARVDGYVVQPGHLYVQKKTVS